MLRSLILAALFIVSASAAIWPEHLGKYERKSARPFKGPLPDEYQEEEAEEAIYGNFMVEARRYKDSTDAFAAWLERPESLRLVGNYLVECGGNCPKDLDSLVEKLPKFSHAALPTLRNYLP